MSAKIRFVVLAVALSALLFAGLWWISGSVQLYDPQVAGFLIPTVAVILAAQGVPLRRRVTFAVITALAFAALGVLGSTTGLEGLAESGFDFASRPLQSLLGLLYSCLVIALPVVVLILFVGRNPTVLWEDSNRGA